MNCILFNYRDPEPVKTEPLEGEKDKDKKPDLGHGQNPQEEDPDRD